MSMEKWMESSRESNQDTLAISDKILKFVEDARGQVTVTDVAIRTRISPQQAQTHLNALAQLTPCDFTVSEHGEMVFNFLEVTIAFASTSCPASIPLQLFLASFCLSSLACTLNR